MAWGSCFLMKKEFKQKLFLWPQVAFKEVFSRLTNVKEKKGEV